MSTIIRSSVSLSAEAEYRHFLQDVFGSGRRAGRAGVRKREMGFDVYRAYRLP